MDYRTDFGPEDLEDTEVVIEAITNAPVTLKPSDLPLGVQLELSNDSGGIVAIICHLRPGNRGIISCVLEMPTGERMLLPIPSFIEVEHFLVNILNDGTIQLESKNRAFGYVVRDTRVSGNVSVDFEIPVLPGIPPEGIDVPLPSERVLLAYNRNDKIVAKVYRVSGDIPEYIVRDTHGEAIAHLHEGELTDIKITGHHGESIFFRANKDGVKIIGPEDVRYTFDSVVSKGKIEAGQDGILKGKMNGGRPVVMASMRELGVVKNLYNFCNEDNGGFDSGTSRIVVADGIGSQPNAEHAADLGVETMLHSGADIATAYELAGRRLKFLNAYFQSNEQKADTVLAAAQIKGDLLETLVIGDVCVLVIRGDSIVFRTIEHTIGAELMALGESSVRKLCTTGQFSIVTSTLLYTEDPDMQQFQLQRGDRVLVMSDGAVMPDDVLVRAVQGFTADNAIKNLLDDKREENLSGGAVLDPHDGEMPLNIASYDNSTFALYIHD